MTGARVQQLEDALQRLGVLVAGKDWKGYRALQYP